MKLSDLELVAVGGAVAAGYLLTGEAVAAAAVFALWLGCKLLTTHDGLSVLALAFIFQWTQVSIGLFYTGVTGRPLITSLESDYRPMVLIGLGCILALAAGVRFGVYLIRRRPEPSSERPAAIMSWPTLITLYVVATMAEPAINQIAQVYPVWRQLIITVMVSRLGLVFLIARRLAVPTLRWPPLLLLLTLEVARGFTGFFAGFREPLVLGFIVLLEVFDRRRAAHWATLVTVVVVMATASLMWMGVRTTYRAEYLEADSLAGSQSARLNRISDLGSSFFKSDVSEIKATADNLVDRVWAIYYPALAVERVPRQVPHTGGSLLWTAVQHVLTPRVFFPEKPDLISDSELVRHYSGVWVAGSEQNTSIAFGYAAESYIDFGIPIMFLPPLVYGVLMGLAYAWLVRHIRHVELMVATVNVIFWLALYLFERSWSNTLGNAMSLLVYLAIPIALVDDFLLVRVVQRRRAAHTEHPEYQM